MTASAVTIDEVEPASELFKRFGYRSHVYRRIKSGSARSAGGSDEQPAAPNSGEGGEDPARYGTNKVSRIKQVFPGRFGVTPAYPSMPM